MASRKLCDRSIDESCFSRTAPHHYKHTRPTVPSFGRVLHRELLISKASACDRSTAQRNTTYHAHTQSLTQMEFCVSELGGFYDQTSIKLDPNLPIDVDARWWPSV